MNHRNRIESARSRGRVGRFGIVIIAAVAPGAASAGSFVAGGWDAQYTLTLSYSAAMRAEKPSDALIAGAVDPATGLPTTANADDGDRNFKRGALVNNRASALGELLLARDRYGAMVRGDAFYDDVYHRRNDNDSPSTVNKGGDNDEFTGAAQRYNGGRLRLLDAYGYADLTMFGAPLNLRFGRQVVAWGESLFFSGVASTQGPADATKANVPGVEVKNILLPIAQAALQYSVTSDLSLLAYYHLEYKSNQLEPVGSFFSTSDAVGPGSQFIYGFANPLAGVVPGAPATINIRRDGDIRPSAGGQWGAGLRYQLTGATSVGAYRLRYHSPNPSVSLNYGYAELAPGITTDPQVVPVSYNIRYFDGIDLSALSFSTRLGAANVSGEVSYRDGVDVLVNTLAGATSTRAGVSQALVSSILTLSPNFISQQIDLIGEIGAVRVNHIDDGAGSKTLTNDRSSWAATLTSTFNYRNVFPKWDLAIPVTFSGIVNGTPALAGSFGALYGEHDRRASIGGTFSYLQNLQLGLAYNAFLGSATLAQRPYADRDYVSANLKYSF